MTKNTKIIINSKNRANKSQPRYKFNVQLPYVLTNVKKVSLFSLSMLNDWYNITEESNKFRIDYGIGYTGSVTITISQGLYNLPTLYESIVTQMNITAPGVDFDYNWEYLRDNNKLLFTSTSHQFRINFNITTIPKYMLEFGVDKEFAYSDTSVTYKLYSDLTPSIIDDSLIIINIDQLKSNIINIGEYVYGTFIIPNKSNKLSNVDYSETQVIDIDYNLNLSQLNIEILNSDNEHIELLSEFIMVLDIEYD